MGKAALTQSTENLPKDIQDDIMDKPEGKLDISRALMLRLNNKLSYQQIANILDAPKSTVHASLKPFIALIENPKAAEAYGDNRAPLLNSIEMGILCKLMDEDKVKKATLGNMAYALDKITQARRLEEGKSTANVDARVLTADLSKIDKEIAELEGKRDRY